MDQRVVLGRAAGAAKRAAKKAARDAGGAPVPRPGAVRREREGRRDPEDTENADEEEPLAPGLTPGPSAGPDPAD